MTWLERFCWIGLLLIVAFSFVGGAQKYAMEVAVAVTDRCVEHYQSKETP